LTTDAGNARKILDEVAESFAAEDVAASAFEEPDGSWTLAVHFGNRQDESRLRAVIAAVAGTTSADALTFETLAPTDWVRKGLEALEPVEAGRFALYGAHDAARVRPNRIGIQIEAGLAFGTGRHGTTRGCLLALDRIARKPRRRRSTQLIRARARKPGMLDVGTGTGILAIAAAKALRRPALASDIDARAVRIARDNVQINGVARYVEVIHAGGLEAGRFRRCGPFALIFANILLEPIQRLALPLARLVAPNGAAVLSGLLSAQAASALARYRAQGLVLDRRIRLEGWTTLVLARPVASRRTRAQKRKR
jgi:ribosomal protein L11 methyltransferase